MRQLTGIDTSFLSMETPNQFGHVSSITIYDLAEWDPDQSFYDAIASVIERRIHLLPLLRRRLVQVPFGLDHPYWINDPDFDLEFHVRNLALPHPGSDAQLAEQVARLSARALDRTRPLWEIYVIDGLADNRVAMLAKIHHATIDGMQGVELLTTLLDTDPGGREIEPPKRAWTGEQMPTTGELIARTIGTYVRNPARAARLSFKAMSSAAGMARSGTFRSLMAPAAAPFADMPLVGALSRRLSGRQTSSEVFPMLPDRPAPRTPFNAAITPHRRYAFKALSLDETKEVKNTFGVTINDVVLAVCAGALRRYLVDLQALPADPLVAMVPVSVRTGKESDPYSNQVAAVLALLHTNIDDPVDRLRAIHLSMAAAKGMSKAVPADLLTDLAHFAPPAVFARASRMATRTGVMNRMNPPFNLVISNVPGPAVQLYTGGAKLEHFYPVSTVVDGQGMNITVQSYLGNLDFGVITCRELVPDAWQIVDYLADALAELLTCARSTAAPSALAATGITATRPAKRQSTAPRAARPAASGLG